MKNPWTKLGSKLIYENEWLSLREDRVIRPDGKEGIYSVIDTRIATGVCALTPRREIYLVGQYRYPTDVYSWEIVEGGTDKGEDPLVCAKRELKEEAGLIAHSWRQLGGEIHLSNCLSSEIGFLYVAEDIEETAACPDETEVLQIRCVRFAEALAMVDRGEIVDAFSIIAILRLQRLLQGV